MAPQNPPVPTAWTQPYPGQPGQPPVVFNTEPKKSKAPLIVGLTAVGLAVVLIIVAISMISSPPKPGSTGDLGSKDYFELGSDKIPSIPFVLKEPRTLTEGEQRDSGYGYASISLTYDATNVSSQSDLNQYIRFLLDKDGYTLTKYPSYNIFMGDIELWKPSEDPGNLLTITITFNDSRYYINIHKTEGFDPNPDTDLPEIGGQTYGIVYVVPAGWVKVDRAQSKLYLQGPSTISVGQEYWSKRSETTYIDDRVNGVKLFLGDDTPTEVTPVTIAGQEGWRLTYSDTRTAQYVVVYTFQHESDAFDVQCSTPLDNPATVTRVGDNCQALAESIRLS
ncbi:MAG: hypothetical protein FWG08_02690 [Propionibacteriaceae bacterium]|nr:hypothetical protein [Propionibacteriaceae bacterium]